MVRSKRRPERNNPTNGAQQQFLITLKWLTFVILLVTGSTTWKLASSDGDALNASGSYLMDLPSEVWGQIHMNMMANGTASEISSSIPPQTPPEVSACAAEYQRVTANRTRGLTDIDMEQSRALLGNRRRLGVLAKKLQERREPVNVAVAGGSITLGHGVMNNWEMRYSRRLEIWMNEYFPLGDSTQIQNKHKVFNVGTHGADICAMAKRLNIMLQNLPPNLDLVVLEFAVNDYQGQDHTIHLDHKTDVFFEGFEKIVVCTEIVVHRLLSQFPDTAVVFLEFQTAIQNRKTAAALHMAVAKHYEVPVISYAESFFPDFYRLLDRLKEFEYSTATINKSNPEFTGDPVLPYPHGCVPCLYGHIDVPFRPMGCKSLCVFVMRSGHPELGNCKQWPAGREPCYVSFLAHDAVHPSAVGHQMAAELIAEAIVRTGRELCEGREYPRQVLPPLGLMVSDPATLAKQSNFVYVKDTIESFGKLDSLVATSHSEGFSLYGDGMADRQGWIATNPQGNEFVEFTMDMPYKPCYVVYLAVLKSYEKMGTFTVTVVDERSGKETVLKVDGLWKPRISIPSDLAVTGDKVPGCTGKCRVGVTTNPQIEGRAGNKVKVMTLSARECVV